MAQRREGRKQKNLAGRKKIWIESAPMTAPRTLSETVRELVRNRPATLTLAQLAQDCGVTEAWLASLTRSKPPKTATADRCQRVYEYLTGKPLLPTE